MHEVGVALDNGGLHGERVRHRRVVHAQALDRRVEEVEALLGDDRRDGGVCGSMELRCVIGSQVVHDAVFK